ncbi:unnamed protein product [Oppiella nova]|uniref:Uncharacterized protein n=1 Tax=Oppiella nova TaxID=334625 RepID=A0A7R9MM76_9ACAR|nr:unnamed protein product [Oppiella nova]CAG2179770.1 unnamed protein product [Oppiella nova]
MLRNAPSVLVLKSLVKYLRHVTSESSKYYPKFRGR